MLKRLYRKREEKAAQPVLLCGGWRTIFEPYTGAWQSNDEIKVGDLRSFFAIYSCITLIAGDISKLRARVMAVDTDGIMVERNTPQALRRANRNRSHSEFRHWWE